MSATKTPIPDCNFNDVKVVVMRELAPAGVTWEQCQSRTKGFKNPHTFARQVMAYLCYTCTTMSYPEIAKAMRVKAVSHAGTHGQVGKVVEMIEADAEVRWVPGCRGMAEVMADYRAMVRDEVAKRQEAIRA